MSVGAVGSVGGIGDSLGLGLSMGRSSIIESGLKKNSSRLAKSQRETDDQYLSHSKFWSKQVAGEAKRLGASAAGTEPSSSVVSEMKTVSALTQVDPLGSGLTVGDDNTPKNIK